VAITMGDPNGIGPELILKAYKEKEIKEDFFVVGDIEVLSFCNELLRYNVPIKEIFDLENLDFNYVNVINLNLLKKEELEIGKISKKSGIAAKGYLDKAAKLALEKKINAIVTLPINKEAVRLSDPRFTGHTEFLAQKCNQTNYTMMLATEKMFVTHVSTHVSLKDAINLVKKENILSVIRLTQLYLKKFLKNPKLAVAGLNPHAGENGSFGDEEINEIIPAVLTAQKEGINIEGPISPDVVFLKLKQGIYDAVVCMYHDQGHIPIKLLDFEGGVNITLGLDFTRTSVDHGTAFDIAYKGISSPKSLINAYKYALKLVLK
jgi:4-hydroxythreonine-4-phosphate dehydrogenase